MTTKPRPRLGALVVGQSPRPEVEAEIRALADGLIDLDLRGALDGLSRAAIDAMVPVGDGDALFTRLPNGEGVTISKRGVEAHGTDRLAALAGAGCDVILVLCTGAFPDWMQRFRVIFPSRALAASVSACLPSGRLGVFVPLAAQCAGTRERWRSAGYDACVTALSPNASQAEARQAAAAMRAAKPELLLLDCVSYTRAFKHAVREAGGAPAILALSSAVRTALELVE